MLPEALKPLLVNVLARGFSTDDIQAIGKHLEDRFNVHMASGQAFGTMLRPDQAAKTIVGYFDQKGKLEGLLGCLIQIAAHADTSILGRSVEVPEFQSFMQRLGQMGLRYDPVADRLVTADPEDLDTWGYLQEGKVFDFSFLSIDIAGNSKIQLKYPKDEIEFVYGALLQMFRRTINRFNGKIWSWAGDGGICAFYLGNRSQDAVECALGLHFNMHLFNLDRQRNRFQEPIKIRIAAHDGQAAYKADKGSIFSDAINYVAHLEKSATEVGGISISKNAYDSLDSRLQSIFTAKGPFEDIEIYSTSLSLGWPDFNESTGS